MKKILIIEDDIAIANIERDYLECEDYEVEIVTDGNKALKRGLSGEFNLILLDLMLPGIDGFKICKKLRKEISIPILMVTARQEDIEKVRGLSLGADDYIEKPFSPAVLVAKVKANLAQYERVLGLKEKADEIIVKELRLNKKNHRVFLADREIELKNKEYELLLFLMENEDIIFSRNVIYERVWGMDSIGEDITVAVHINRLRDKIEKIPSNPQYIETIRGAGYRLNGK